MATIVNSPTPQNDSSGGFMIAFFVLIALGLLFYYVGLPAIRQTGSTQPQINVPDKVDVNLNQNP